MNSRNRSEGWKHAKISGHTNESDITSKINKNKLYRENLEKKLNLGFILILLVFQLRR